MDGSRRRRGRPSSHLRTRRRRRQQIPRSCAGEPTAPAPFTNLPPELLVLVISPLSGTDLAAASATCRSWRVALQPLRDAAASHVAAKRLKRSQSSRDRARAKDALLKAAALGSPAAMVDAGLMLWEEGRQDEAIKLYRCAAENRNPTGMLNLGLALLANDAREAVYWFSEAAGAGNFRAQYNLALCLQNGRGIKRDPVEAAKWYLAAAKGGNLRAMYNTSLCYSLGQGFEKNLKDAQRWLSYAAGCGHKRALYELGLQLQSSGENEKAFLYFELAARRGEAAATHARDELLESLSLRKALRIKALADSWSPLPLRSR